MTKTTQTDLLGAALYAGALGGAGSWLGVRLFILARLAAGLLLEVLGGELGFVKSAIHYEVQHGLYDHLDGKTWLTVKRWALVAKAVSALCLVR